MTKPFIFLLAAATLLVLPTAVLGAEGAPRLTPETVHQMMDAPDVIVLDVRTPSAWKAGDKKIKGAVRKTQTFLDIHFL